MIVIVGLGNPEEKYKNTRHNVGSEAIHYLTGAWGAPLLRENKKTFSHESTVMLQNEKVLLVIPTTYMNESGKSVQALSSYYDVPVKNIWVIHDDLDINIGDFKIAFNRGSAGNNGIKDISQKLATQKYYRWRIGIRSETLSIFGAIRKSFVLSKLRKGDADKIKSTFQKIKESLELALQKDPEFSMNKYN